MISEEHIKEGLSLAYVTAMAHMAGLLMSFHNRDYGIDGGFEGVNIRNSTGERFPNGYKIDFQLKASINKKVIDNHIHFPLASKNYNDLVETDVGTPKILIVFFLPQDRSQWLTSTENKLTMKHCAWWFCLRGMKPTSNVGTKTIHIPVGQILNSQILSEMMTAHKEGKLYGYLQPSKITI